MKCCLRSLGHFHLSLISLMFVCLIVIINASPPKTSIELTDDDWPLLAFRSLPLTTLNGRFDGHSRQPIEWMIKFYAPWCRACQRMLDEWEKFAQHIELEDGFKHAKVASVDVTTNPFLSRKFVISTLPTIVHVRNGVYRVYRGTRDSSSFFQYLKDGIWQESQGTSLSEIDNDRTVVGHQHEQERGVISSSDPMNPMDFLAAVHSGSSDEMMSSSSLSESVLRDSPANSQSSPMALLSRLQTLPMSASSAASGMSMLSEKPRNQPSDDEEDEEEEEFKLSIGNDCLTSRSTAEAVRKSNPTAKTYVPECTEGGLYREVQCYQSFCWCVDVHKGLPMKGSGSMSTTTGSTGGNLTIPDCSQKKPVSKIRDCPLEQKLQFLKALRALFHREMITFFTKQARNRPVGGQRETAVREGRNQTIGRRVVNEKRLRANYSRRTPLPLKGASPPTPSDVLVWKFSRIDRNHDGVINETEWRNFRKSFRGRRKARLIEESFHEVKHCFKLFFRGCDLNRDGSIVDNEWFECTGREISLDEDFLTTSAIMTSLMSGGGTSSMSSLTMKRKKKRKGPNPFATILKAD